MIRNLMLAVVAAAAFAVTSAGAQSKAVPDLRSVPELAYEFDKAVVLGIPVGPLEAKAREGYLKGATGARVHVAVKNLSAKMVEAKEALSPVQSQNEVLEGAKALQQGVPASVLRDMRKVQRTRSLEVSLGVLTELVVRKIPMQKAADAVTKMLKTNVTEGVMIAFGRGVQGDISAGLAPTVALDIRSRGVLSLPAGPAQGAALSPGVRIPPP
jgi:hypothetical protein